MDKFLLFSLPLEDQAFINKHLSPRHEASLLKKVCITDIVKARKILSKIGIKTRTKYRGPRYDCGKYTTRKKDAYWASIYKKYSRLT